eukprot:c17308_g1_i1 orf=178-1131(-)
MESAHQAQEAVPSQTLPSDAAPTIPTANDFQNLKRVLELDGTDPAAKKPCLEEAAPESQDEVAAEFKDEVRVEADETVEKSELAEEEPYGSQTHGAGDVEESHVEKPVNVFTNKEGGTDEVKLGPKMFGSSVEMFNYFYKLLHGWPVNFNMNKYEHMVLLDLIQKGHPDPQQKIGAGIESFQIRVNPEYCSKCYYVVRQDGTMDNFSYRKCVDKLLPLPSNMKTSSGALDIDSILSLDKNGHKDSSRKDHGHNGGKMGGYHHNNKGRGGTFGRRGRFDRGGRFYGHRHGRMGDYHNDSKDREDKPGECSFGGGCGKG